jgi:hypothetical protein
VQKNIKKAATGDAYHVQWDAVVSAFDTASVNERSKSSLKAHFAATPHSSLAELATGEQTTHAGSRWGASAACGGRVRRARLTHPFPTLTTEHSEEVTLIKATNKYLDAKGRVDWDAVAVFMEAKGFSRSASALKAHAAKSAA